MPMRSITRRERMLPTDGEGDDLCQAKRAEAVVERGPRSFAGVTLAPERMRQPPADLNARGKRPREIGAQQAGEAEECAAFPLLHRPEAEAVTR